MNAKLIGFVIFASLSLVACSDDANKQAQLKAAARACMWDPTGACQARAAALAGNPNAAAAMMSAGQNGLPLSYPAPVTAVNPVAGVNPVTGQPVAATPIPAINPGTPVSTTPVVASAGSVPTDPNTAVKLQSAKIAQALKNTESDPDSPFYEPPKRQPASVAAPTPVSTAAAAPASQAPAAKSAGSAGDTIR